MLEQEIHFENFDGVTETTKLYFNITRTEMTDHLDVIPEVEAVQKMIQGDGSERQLSVEEIKRVLELVKTFAAIAYGERSEDGRKFRKTDPVTGASLWDEFKTTAEYDAFMTLLFDPPENAIAFVFNILPNALRGEAVQDYLAKNPGDPDGVVAAIKQAQETGIVEKPATQPAPVPTDAPEVGEQTVELPASEPVLAEPSGPPVAPDDAPKDPESYTRQERLAMSQETFDRIYGTDTSKWSQTTLMAAYQRKNQQM